MAGELKTIYNNQLISTSTADDTFTLNCNGKLMASDVTIQATDVDSLTVTYGGNTIATGSGTVTKILNCDGRYMSSDVGVAVTMASGPAIITVVGLGNSDPSTVTFTTTGTFNWNFAEVTVNGNVFIKIPTMYRKVEAVTNNQITSFSLSNTQVDSTYQPYPCFVNGNSVLPYVLIGKYCSSSTSVMNSVDATPATQTTENARTNARALGTGYQLYDWQFQKLFIDLALCRKEAVDFNSGQEEIDQYLGISHLSSNVWVDGIYHAASTLYACDDATKYVSSPSSVPTGYYNVVTSFPKSSGNITALWYNANHPFVNYPKTTSGATTYTTYYCDRVYYSPRNNHPFYTCVGSLGAMYGLWNIGSYTWTLSLPARLCYRPI